MRGKRKFLKQKKIAKRQSAGRGKKKGKKVQRIFNSPSFVVKDNEPPRDVKYEKDRKLFSPFYCVVSADCYLTMGYFIIQTKFK